MAWLAGLLEGEGCFHLERARRPRMAMQMTDEDVVRRAHEVSGVGTVKGPYFPSAGNKPAWRWLVSRHEDVRWLLTAIRPYMGERRRAKIDLCLAYEPKARERRWKCARGHPMEGANLYVSPKGHRTCITCYTAREGYPPVRR